ncbi:MAG: RNA polymerase sigma factor [Tenuifilum sp.]|uniref:RNA polymerase sigma factor n=1 Tax=Tenuifilum sp. TaxID=2760880 RepID=UPI001B656919|nr:RNA polymerase sigma factor [Bacteroidales bacterium]HOK61653.1 RNA polymerase sigma factor [Tenuifilum sp.]MBP9029697.1 RNA polymerase sigma factor [Bacteroidales bacterium]HOK86362.1 RNA polymerase sigma factor [Tenuifilum sp.]HON70514.1 RNA polymerase sigma factor [Tenuifilum sp.]
MSREERFKRTVDENKEKIMRICRYYAPSAEDQKDMYQEILINIWKSLDSFRGDSKVSTWVYRIAVNTSLSYAGKQYKLMKLNVDIENTNIKNFLSTEFNDNMLKDDQFQRLQTHLNQLSVIDKAIMGLVLDELTSKEIADIIGITEPNVRIKIHRIKENLRNQMKGENYE